MAEYNISDLEGILRRIRTQAKEGSFRITQHAQQEMVEDAITLDEAIEAITTGRILENYPEHKRGACCLVNGFTQTGRPMHIVCTTAWPLLILITAYEPKLPKWVTPTQRRQ